MRLTTFFLIFGVFLLVNLSCIISGRNASDSEDIGGDTGERDSGSGPNDSGTTSEWSACNYTDDSTCWSCRQDEKGKHCKQLYPEYPSQIGEWTCWDTNGTRICQNVSDTPQPGNDQWDCEFLTGQGNICTRKDPDLPDKDHEWECRDENTIRYCDEVLSCQFGHIIGTACDPATQRALANATIVANVDGTCASSATMSTTADSAGNFELANVPIGEVTVTISGGSVHETYVLTITPGMISIINENGCDRAHPDNPVLKQTVDFHKNQYPCSAVWIASGRITSNTVTRVDVDTLATKTYYTHGKNPSRTAVDMDCNVWVANRGPSQTDPNVASIIKLKDNCSETATNGPDDPCMKCLIHLNDEGWIRGVAVDKDNSVWFGSSATGNIYHYDSNCNPIETLDPLVDRINGEGRNYGFAMFHKLAQTYLWISHYTKGVSLIIFNLETGVRSSYSLIKTGIGDVLTGIPYGIAVDKNGDAWIGMYGGSASRLHFNGSALMLQGYSLPSGKGVNGRGITVDIENDLVWIAGCDGKIAAMTLEGTYVGNSYMSGISSYGVDIDNKGRLWPAGGDGRAFRIEYIYDAVSNNLNFTSSFSVSTGPTSYTYSDFSGYGLFNYLLRGVRTITFDSSTTASSWQSLSWSGMIYPEAEFRFKFRAANSTAALEDAAWSESIPIPSPIEVVGSINLTDFLTSPYQYLQVEITVNLPDPSLLDDLLLEITAQYQPG